MRRWGYARTAHEAGVLAVQVNDQATWRRPVAPRRVSPAAPRLVATTETVAATSAYPHWDEGAADGSSDGELMARVRSGDQQAFATIYDRHVRTVYGVVLRYLGDPGSAEDVVQETYMTLWVRSEAYQPEEGPLLGWLLTIARNRAIDRLRGSARRPLAVGLAPAPGGDGSSDEERLVAIGEPVGFGTSADEPGDLAERRWRRAVVRAALAGMPHAERHALELAYDEGLTQVEVAQRLGLPLGTVKTRTRRGLLRLRAMLASVPDIGPDVGRAADGLGPAGGLAADGLGPDVGLAATTRGEPR